MYIREDTYFPGIEFDIQIHTPTWKKVWTMEENKPKGSYLVVLQPAINISGIPCSYLSNGCDILKPGSQLGVVKFKGYCRLRVLKVRHMLSLNGRTKQTGKTSKLQSILFS